MEATAISGPAYVGITKSARLEILLVMTFVIATQYAPHFLASSKLAIVSAVSPLWLIKMAYGKQLFTCQMHF